MSELETGVTILGGEGGDEVSLLEILDHLVNSGVVIHGTLVISLAGVDLIFLGLNVVLTSIESAHQSMAKHATLKPTKTAARPRERR
jgi:hypothetical protein